MLYLKQLFIFIEDMIKGRKIIFELAQKDFKSKYLGSYLGIIWAFVQPIITVIIFWFVFQEGFKTAPINNFPYVLWLLTGMIPWFFFSESLSSSTNAIVEYSYLVKQVVFRVGILPVIRIISALFVHLFFLIFLFFMFWCYGYKPNLYNLQAIYYLLATITLVLGLSWITSSLMVFLKDIGQIVGVVLQFGFWITPIFWSLEIIPINYRYLIKLNPIFYIIDGYRNTFIYHRWFWQEPSLTIYFWALNLTLLVSGALIFRRLRPHFADVL